MSVHPITSCFPNNVQELTERKASPSVSSKIRQHIAKLPPGLPFCSGDLLTYGTRSTVDQTLKRILGEGRIVRVVRGVYMKQKPNGEMLSSFDVARAKAKAFNRELLIPNGLHAIDVNANGDLEITYLATGSSSSFKYGNVRIRFKGVAPSRAAKLSRSNQSHQSIQSIQSNQSNQSIQSNQSHQSEWPNLTILPNLNAAAQPETA